MYLIDQPFILVSSFSNDKGGDKSQKGRETTFSTDIKKGKKFNFNWYLDWYHFKITPLCIPVLLLTKGGEFYI
jgi:hypothetical protein